MTERTLIGQMLRYGVVGIATNLAGFLVYLALTWGGLAPKIAMSGLYVLGATLSFVLNRRWTFGHRGAISGAGVRFVLAHLAGYGINLALLVTLHDLAGLPHPAVQAGAVVIVAGFLFVAFRLFVFPARSPA